MKLKKLLVLTLIMSFVFAQSFGQDAWKSYKNKKGKFSINLPDKPKKSKTKKNDIVTYKIEVKDGGVTYMANATLHASDLGNVEGLLETSTNAFVQSFDGTVDKKEDFLYGREIGKISYISGTKNSKVVYCVFLRGNVQYQLVVITIGDFANKTDVGRFLGSFKVI